MGIFATTEINKNKDNFYLLKNNTNKDYNFNIYKNIYMYIFFKLTLSKVSILHIFICTNNILYLLQNNTKKNILAFQNTMLILS